MPQAEEAPESDVPPSESSLDVAGLFREHNAALVRFTKARLGSEHEAREVARRKPMSGCFS